jgi:hypothetical protein
MAKRGKHEDPASDPLTTAANAIYYAKLKEAVDRVLGHDGFADLQKLDAIPITTGTAESGTQSQFDKTEFPTAIKKKGLYKCAGNLAWRCPYRPSTRGVRIQEAQVEMFKKTDFKDPGEYPYTVSYACISEACDVEANWGNLDGISPEEPEHALWFRIDEEITAGVDGERLLKWKTMMRTVSGVFVKCDSVDTRMFHAYNARRHVQIQAKGVTWSEAQMCDLVNEYKSFKEKLTGESWTPAMISKEFGIHTKQIEGVDPAASAEVPEVSKTYVEQCLSVKKNLLDDTTARELIEACDKLLMNHSPLNSMESMFLIAQKSKNIEDVHWVLRYIVDLLESRESPPSEFSTTRLKGDAQNRSILYTISAKKELKRHYLGDVLSDLGIPADHRKLISEALENHGNMRKFFGWPRQTLSGGKAGVDLSWQSGWPSSSIMAASLGLEIIFKCVHDSGIKAILKSKKTSIEAFEVVDGTIYQQMEIIKGQLEAEAERKLEDDKRLKDSLSVTAVVDDTGKNKDDDDDVEEKTAGDHAVTCLGEGHSDKDVDHQTKTLLGFYYKKCEDKVNTAKIVTEPKTEALVADCIKQSPVGQLLSTATDETPIIMDYGIQCCGEAASNPKTRPPSHRPTHYNKLLCGGLHAFAAGGSDLEVPKGLVITVEDAGKLGLYIYISIYINVSLFICV